MLEMVGRGGMRRSGLKRVSRDCSLEGELISSRDVGSWTGKECI